MRKERRVIESACNERLPVCAQDTFNYMASYFFSNYQIQYVLKLEEEWMNQSAYRRGI
ncbi:hypothetical protein [Aneurinibacillus danicus]|jgi:hypothetical protein|uniref:Uncharacterized protein n=1 Tax=Aneurinibacillus danicus TaxID=267746 RepID=A0A511V771_9BACL|nr:hypothetical protein [Aneurinibacillus danicus]GEN34784.1 hypothetical protein ADA01nite_22440 [Aneurinibacillus danicus]